MHTGTIPDTPQLPGDVITFLRHLGPPATPEAGHDLARHFRAQAERLTAKAAALTTTAQLLDDGLIPDVEPVGDLPVVPDWAHLGAPPLTIMATRLGLAVCGIDVPPSMHPVAGLKRGVNAVGAFEVEITPDGVCLYWREVLEEDFLAFNLQPKTRAEGETMAESFRQMAEAVVAAGDLAEYRREVPGDRLCSGCGTRPVRPTWECDPKVIRDHRDQHLCPVCAATTGVGEVPPKIREGYAALCESLDCMDMDDLLDETR